MVVQKKVALIESKPSRTRFEQHFDNAFQFDRYSLTSDSSIKKVLKKHVDIEIDLDQYDWVILVGADSFKYFTKLTSITNYSGNVVEDKFLPVINPAMVSFKPEVGKIWEDSKSSIIGYITGEKKVIKYDTDVFKGIQDTEEAIKYVKKAIASPNPMVALDSETTGLYPRDGHVLGVSLSYKRNEGVYIDADCIDDRLTQLFQTLFNKKTVVFHNAKFDIPFLNYHFGWIFLDYEDTMLLHYLIDENPGNHGLKKLALEFTEYGDYEQPLHEWIAAYCKANGVLKSDFTWDVIPFDIMKTYAAIDSAVTFLLYIKFKPAIMANKKLLGVYEKILIPGCSFLIDVQDNGVPFDIERLKFSQKVMQASIDDSVAKLYSYSVVKEFEEYQEKEFNPNSVMQLRKLLFDYLKLTPTGKRTGTGQHSTDAEVLTILGSQHEVPAEILNIRKKGKIKNTYLDKIIPAIDRDGRLRTNFNLHGTTSGRLSSSGKLNMQQLPRDEPAVKGSIRARPGYKIVSADLTTAEVYVASVLAQDESLMDVFRSGGDFHSTIAKKVFKLTCDIEEVATLHPLLRQAAKAITFGIMYGAGPMKISEQVTKDARDRGMDYTFSVEEAKSAIYDYFKEFSGLKAWIDKSKKEISSKGFVHSHFGRKRRLPNVKSKDRGVQGHAVRSGLNFLVQSPASDINLLAGIEMNNWIKKHGMDAKIFALVHDSILAEVKEEAVEEYQKVLNGKIKTDRGLSIPGHSIGCDFEIGDDYSFGKFEKKYEQV